MRRKSVAGCGILLVALALASTVAPAKAMDALEPGLWSVATRIGHDDVLVPLRSFTRCITLEEAKTFDGRLTTGVTTKDLACKVAAHRKTDNREISHVRCTAGNLKFDATITYTLDNPQHYTVVFDATVPSSQQSNKLTQIVEGRRLGECAK
jgi:hypothetical protein